MVTASRYWSTSFAVRSLSLLLSALLLGSPVGAFAATPAAVSSPAQILRTADDAAVSRGDFVRAAIKALKLPLEKGRKELPYKNVPPTLRQYIQKAHTLGALKVFGADLQSGKAITRGEALILLTELFDQTAKAAKFSYTDVRGTEIERAVGLALEREWMKPRSGRTFGVSQPLKGKEAKLLLSRVMRSNRSPQTETITVPIIRVNVESRSLPKEDVLRAVWNLLQDDYLYKEKLNPEKAMNQSISGLVNSLSDPYTTYLPKTSSENFQNQLKGEVEGIGATVEQTGGIVVIVAPLKGSPAEKAGLQAKDQILAADDVSLLGLPLDEAIQKIRGPKGTTVKLKIRRDGNEFDVSVTRDRVTIPEVDITMQDSIAIVKIYQFGQTTDTALRAKMTDVQRLSPRGIILDLRNNPGGLLHAASSVVGIFLPKGSPYATIVGRSDSKAEETDEEPVIDANVPVVVLVNEGSASASEIVAGALQDAKRARVLGKKTFGKGTVQQVIQFTDGSSLKMTVAEWKTPSGRKIDGAGLEPDEVIEKGSERDEQLLRAIEILR